MNDVSSRNFGYLISYVLPGFVTLWGMSHHSPTLKTWLAASPTDDATVGGFLYVTVLSVGAGLIVSTVRWLVVDTIHVHTGVPRPEWNFARLEDAVPAFERLIEDHYRYYQFYANGLISLIMAMALRWTSAGFTSTEALVLTLLIPLLFAASRDTLSKYFRRVEEVLRREDGRSRLREEVSDVNAQGVCKPFDVEE